MNLTNNYIDEEELPQFKFDLCLKKETFDAFYEKLQRAEKGKLCSKKKNIYITVRKWHIFEIEVCIKTKMDKIPCMLICDFSYDKLKKGIFLSLIYDDIQFRPFTLPLSMRGDEEEDTMVYQKRLPFRIWMTEENKFLMPYFYDDCKAIAENNTKRIEIMKDINGEEYVNKIKNYFLLNNSEKWDIAYNGLIAATKMFGRLIEFMEEIASER